MTSGFIQRLCKALAGALIALMGGAAWSCPGGTDVARAHGAWFSRAGWTGTGAAAEGDFVLDGANANANPSGIAFGEGRFHAVDSLDDRVYAYSASGRREPAADFSLHADKASPLGIAFVGGRFYVADAGRARVFVHASTGQPMAQNDSPNRRAP